MSLQRFLIFALLAILSVTQSDGAGTISISITPVVIKEFASYTIRCQYPAPGVNASTTGLLQITHMTSSNDVIYAYNFDANKETISSAITMRATAALNRTATVVVVDVQVAYASDSGAYSCTLPDPTNNNITLTATTNVPLNVTGCVGGSQVGSITGCPPVSVGQSCSISCNSNIVNASVSLSKYISGSPQIASDLTAVNYTIASVQNSDFGFYFCYVRTDKCSSMATTSVNQAPATTAPPGGGCGSGGGCGKSRLPGWGIALIVIACVIALVIIAAIIIFLLHKKGFLHREKETGVQPTNGGQGRTVSNDVSRAKSAGKNERNGKFTAETNNSAAVVSFPEVKTRKNQLPPLEPISQGWNRRQTTEENSSPDVSARRPLPKRATQDDRGGSPPTTEKPRRSSQARRGSDDGGDSPDRGRLPPIRISSHRERDEEDEEPGRF